MKRATLTALEKSIKKWEAIVDGTGADEGGSNCALCKRFAFGCHADDYDGELCPVAKTSGEINCIGTPWEDWIEGPEGRSGRSPSAFSPRKAADDESVMCAVLELEYLKSLLPSRKRKPS